MYFNRLGQLLVITGLLMLLYVAIALYHPIIAVGVLFAATIAVIFVLIWRYVHRQHLRERAFRHHE